MFEIRKVVRDILLVNNTKILVLVETKTNCNLVILYFYH